MYTINLFFNFENECTKNHIATPQYHLYQMMCGADIISNSSVNMYAQHNISEDKAKLCLVEKCKRYVEGESLKRLGLFIIG